MRRVLPKITLKDLDWKIVALLGLLLIVTWGDDFVIPIIGEMLDPVELVIDVVVAYVLGKRTLEHAMNREAETVVEGKVVDK